MYKTEEELKLENEARKYTSMNKIIDNLKVKQQNGRLWTPYHDMQLYEYVIKYNFNFYQISNAFQKLCINDKKYEYSEDAVRLHWAFLHAMRNFDQTPDEAYYQRMKLQYDKEKPKSFKNTVEEREKMLSEEEDIRRMKAELDKIEKDKEEKEKKIKEEKEKKEKERIEKEKKEDEEVEELISTTTKRKEESKEDKENEIKKAKNEEKTDDDKKGKKSKLKANNDNKLYDENNEPEFIKQLFSKNIPKEILDKLNKDQGKYNKNNTNDIEENNNKILEDKKDNNKKQNIINEIKVSTNPKERSYKEININSNLDINEELSKKEKEKNNTNNNIINEEEDLFPIKSHKQKEISEPGKIENINMEKELRNTQDFNDYIESNPELKKQYDQLNNYCNFAVKSINYIVNKGAGMDNTSESEAKKIEQANRQLNQLMLEPIMKKTEEEGFTLEDWNKRIEEEEHKMNFETTNYDNYMKNAPKDEERDMKLNKFKEHLFGFAEKISTEELLEKITGIIGEQNNIENEGNNNENNNQININNNINNNNINLENRIQNFMNNLENNNLEDEKSENTKEQSENITENAGDDNGRNTISSVSSLEIPKKYRHVYRGMVYYNDKPDENDKKNKSKNNNNKKRKDEDDEIEEDDDDDDDDYNK